MMSTNTPSASWVFSHSSMNANRIICLIVSHSRRSAFGRVAMNASTPSLVLMAHMMSASAICLTLMPWISIIVFAFVFRLTFKFDFAVNNLLLEGCACTEQDDVFSMLLWYLNYYLHLALLTLCVYYSKESSICQPTTVVKKPHSPGEVPGRVARPSGPDR